MSVDRRRFLSLGLGTAAGALALGKIPSALASVCGVTPPQTSGPFYPGEQHFQPENDLTRVPGRPGRALGQVIYVRGTVQDQNCQPVAGANVELWQACASGKYNHRSDPNPAALDPNFRYWGEADTDAEGAYLFKTIIPGAYPANASWDRPPHLHFRITKRGYWELVTQMYFEGHPLNGRDLILQELSTEEQSRVVVRFTAAPAGFEPGALMGEFSITLRSLQPHSE
jgi:protocatechuate 3,4-dioxygenase beta subunit